MKLSSNDLSLLGQHAIKAARKAGEIISTCNPDSILIEAKKGGESFASQVVTEVDILCQDSILEILAPTCDIFDLALLTEESADDLKRLEKDYFWCIDPLDGTLPFIESTPGYAVSIALVSKNGTPFIGVVYDPVKQTLYHAIKGEGSYRNSKHWAIFPSSKETFTVIADRSFEQHELFLEVTAEMKNIAIDLGYTQVKTILKGGAAMNACWVLENAPACYFKFPKLQESGGSLWDYAATACILTEAGAAVSDIAGDFLDLNRPDSTFMNHRGVIYASDTHIAEQIMRLYTKLYIG